MRRGKRLLAAALAALLLALAGCAAAPEEESAIVDDDFRNWYEVFVASFSDSDGDGVGDLNGVREKLDYIASLGCNGIWLMPVMPSPSYHKYDVTDYYAVDPAYGTTDDLRALLAAAHERGIRVILDLPINHSSSEHPWFLAAAADEGSATRDWYNWSETPLAGYSEAGGRYYESRFVSTMPDFNLDSAALREELSKIVRFWLADVGADGFRLDAATSYYTGAPEKNVAFLSWLGETARAAKPDAFLVAEVWDDLPTIARYAQADITSVFLFPAAQRTGSIARALDGKADAGESFAAALMAAETALPAASVPAPFQGNHDTPRPVNYLGRKELAKLKMAAGLLGVMRGGVFVYYGEEIGMAGSACDPDKRLGMLWTTQEETTSPPPGTQRIEYVYPSVAEQETDEASLLSFYRAALALRNRNPALARGATEVLPETAGELCVFRRVWGEDAVTVALNLSPAETKTLELPGLVLAGSLCAAEGAVTLEGDVLTLPPYSVALLR